MFFSIFESRILKGNKKQLQVKMNKSFNYSLFCTSYNLGMYVKHVAQKNNLLLVLI